MMEPVTSQPQFGFGEEDQGFFGGKSVLSGLENLSKANEITVQHGRLTCAEGNLKNKYLKIFNNKPLIGIYLIN